MKNIIGGCIYALALIVASPLALPTLTGAEEQPTRARTEISDKQLKSFAKAYVGYQRIRQIYEPKIANTSDLKEKERIRHEGDAKVSQLLARQGLNARIYNRLFNAVNNDKELRQRVLELVNDERRRS